MGSVPQVKRIYLDINPDLHRAMKIEALRRDITLKELIEQRLMEDTEHDKKSGRKVTKGKGKK